MSIARHSVYNLGGYMVPTIVTIITVPIYLRVIGVERYGLLAICWTLLGLMGFFSLGMGPAIAQRLALHRHSPPEVRARLFWTGAALSLIAGLLGTVLLLALSPAYFAAVGGDAGLKAELGPALPFLAAALPLALVSGVCGGALQGRQWFGPLNVINVATSVSIAVLPLVGAIFFGPTLRTLIAATLAVHAASVLVLLLVCRGAVPLTGTPMPSVQLARQLVAFGGWMTITTLVAPLVLLFDRFAIGEKLGSAAVTTYVIPHNLVWRVVLIASSWSNAALPRIAGASAEEEERLKDTGIRILLAILTPLCVAGSMVLGPFLHVWVGEEIGARSTPVAAILMYGVWTYSISHVPSILLMGRGRPDILAKFMLAYVIPYIALIYYLMSSFGLVGAAIAWSLRATADASLLYFVKPTRSQMQAIVVCGAVVMASSGWCAATSWQIGQYWAANLTLLAMALLCAWYVAPRDKIRNLVQSLLASRGISGPVEF